MAPNDKPENSRVFVVAAAGTSQESIRKAFENYGRVEDVWNIKPRRQSTSDSVLCYVKFGKASEALLAVESLNGNRIPGCDKPIKAVIAAQRDGDAGPSRGIDGTDGMERLFLLVRGDDTVESVRNEFDEYGEVKDVLIVRNKFAYVSFRRPYEAALAIEGHEAKKSRFRPVVADVRGAKSSKRDHSPSPHRRTSTEGYSGGGSGDIRNGNHRNNYNSPPLSASASFRGGRGFASSDALNRSAPARASGGGMLDRHGYDRERTPAQGFAGAEGLIDLSTSLINNPTRCTHLYLKVDYPLSREQVFKMCNLIPGLDSVELHGEATSVKKTIASVRYRSAATAALAWQRLQDFEYPPGFLIRLRYADAGFPEEWMIELNLRSNLTTTTTPYQTAIAGAAAPAYATSAVPRGYGEVSYGRDRAEYVTGRNEYFDDRSSKSNDVIYEKPSAYRKADSTVKLGAPQPMLPRDVAYQDRCYFTLSHRISQQQLEETFSSFGDLIEVYYIKHKNCGYALFGSKEAAAQAINALDGQWVEGELFNVVRAEPDPKHLADDSYDR